MMKSPYVPVLLGLLALSTATPAHALVVANNVICATQRPVKIQVSFNAAFENAIILTDNSTGRVAMTFNNFYGRGAGNEWWAGAGTWVSRPGRCYSVRAQHKAGTANPNLPWLPSAVMRTGNKIGFEDGEDGDYNDAVVRIIN